MAHRERSHGARIAKRGPGQLRDGATILSTDELVHVWVSQIAAISETPVAPTSLH